MSRTIAVFVAGALACLAFPARAEDVLEGGGGAGYVWAPIENGTNVEVLMAQIRLDNERVGSRFTALGFAAQNKVSVSIGSGVEAEARAHLTDLVTVSAGAGLGYIRSRRNDNGFITANPALMLAASPLTLRFGERHAWELSADALVLVGPKRTDPAGFLVLSYFLPNLNAPRRRAVASSSEAVAAATPVAPAPTPAATPAPDSTPAPTATRAKKRVAPAVASNLSGAPAASVAPTGSHVQAGSTKAFINTSRAGLTEVEVGKRVTVFRNDGTKATLTVVSLEDSTLVGTDGDGKRVSIPYSDVAQIYAAH